MENMGERGKEETEERVETLLEFIEKCKEKKVTTIVVGCKSWVECGEGTNRVWGLIPMFIGKHEKGQVIYLDSKNRKQFDVVPSETADLLPFFEKIGVEISIERIMSLLESQEVNGIKKYLKEGKIIFFNELEKEVMDEERSGSLGL